MRIHHVCVVLGGLSLLLQTKGGGIGPICLFLTEFSNPFLQSRMIMRKLNMEDTKIFKTNETVFGLIFILNR